MIAPNFKSEKYTGVRAEVADADTWARGPASAAVAAAAAAAWSGTRSSGSGGGTRSQSRMLALGRQRRRGGAASAAVAAAAAVANGGRGSAAAVEAVVGPRRILLHHLRTRGSRSARQRAQRMTLALSLVGGVMMHLSQRYKPRLDRTGPLLPSNRTSTLATRPPKYPGLP
jgi:hypothetical protein